MNIFHIFGFSSNKYICPIKPRSGEKPRFWKDSPAHVSVFKHAKDIIIPDPRNNPLPVYAPAGGTILALVQHNTLWGQDASFLPFLNYVTVQSDIPEEFYQLCHIAKDSCRFKIGDRIEKGAVIAQTGINGYMTDPRHIHFIVGKFTNINPEGFVSLRIRM